MVQHDFVVPAGWRGSVVLAVPGAGVGVIGRKLSAEQERQFPVELLPELVLKGNDNFKYLRISDCYFFFHLRWLLDGRWLVRIIIPPFT